MTNLTILEITQAINDLIESERQDAIAQERERCLVCLEGDKLQGDKPVEIEDEKAIFVKTEIKSRIENGESYTVIDKDIENISIK